MTADIKRRKDGYKIDKEGSGCLEAEKEGGQTETMNDKKGAELR